MWFDEAVCDFCGKPAAGHVTITAPHAEHEWFYAIGVVNLCGDTQCVVECENYTQLRIESSRVRGFNFIWFNTDEEAARFHSMTWREPFQSSD